LLPARRKEEGEEGVSWAIDQYFAMLAHYVLNRQPTLIFEKSYPIDGELRSVEDRAGNPVSSCLSPSVLMGESISGAVVSSSISIRLAACGSLTCVSVELVTCESDGGGVGCCRTSGAFEIVPSGLSSISVLVQLGLSSSGGHEECEEGTATMVSSLEGVGIWSAPAPARLEGRRRF